MIVDLVHVNTRDGMRLDGTWRKPHPEQASQLGVDVVIFHHGVAGNFYSPGMFDQYSDALLDRGCAVLRVNNRGHDPINRVVVGERVKRLGAAYEDMADCRYDWEAWVDFVHAAGYRRIGLWGHSLGATKSIYYMATQHDPRVTCVVAGSPPRFSYAAFAALAEGETFKHVASQAQQHIDRGHPETLIDAVYPIPLLVTAEVFIQKYGPEEKYDILQHIPHVQCPLLVMVGTAEAQTMMAFQGLPPLLEKLAGTTDRVTFAAIPGADHAYTHQRDYVWGMVSRWLEKV
ncbi:MAG: alpha/beta hydrolase family protein [Candidatus Entotheonellia bacterium]